jgi:thiamine-phosphate pyrophosphorylase
MTTRPKKLSERIAQFKQADLYVVITQAFCGGRTSEQVLRDVLAAGVRLVQFREKDITDDAVLFATALRFREITAEAGAVLIIDDRVDIALAVDADGVHLGQRDLPLPVAKNIAPNIIVGASTHSLDQALAAQAAGADYINIGPIYATQTKTKTAPPLGPEIIAEIAANVKIPFTCMGGIKPENVGDLLSRGARHPAVVTAVTAADHPETAARSLRELVLRARS